MRKFALFIVLTLFYFYSFSQIVSLNPSEINKLKLRIQNDTETKKQYLSFEKLAIAALDDLPNPIDTIRSEGLLKGNPRKERTVIALKDMQKMYALALQYRLVNDKKYLAKSIDFLNTWAEINKPNGDPIDDTNLDKAVETYDLIKTELTPADKKQIEDWLTKTATAEINSVRMKPGRGTAINNWNSHRLKEVGEIGYTLNNKELINWTIENLKKHIEVNLNADGTSLDFKERDAMHYHIYDLEPMLRLAILIYRANGTDFYSYQSKTGSSIKKSVNWLIPYIKGEKQHEEYVNTTVTFDRDRAKNNEPGFAQGSMFKPALAIPMLRLAVYFDPSLKELLRATNDKGGNFQMVIEAIQQPIK